MRWLLCIVLSLVSTTAHAQHDVVASADPVLAPMMRPGRSVDAALFTHRRTVRLYPSAEGVSRYALAPADLAVARGDLADVRIVDASGNQASYVVDDHRRERMAVTITRTGREGSESSYAVALPAAPLTLTAVEVTLDRAYVDRRYRLVARIGDSERTVAAGMLEDGVPLLLKTIRAKSLRLMIDDGDDAPLDVRTATITFAGADLFVVAPSGAYTLLLGNDDIDAPRYELTGVRDRVLASPAGEVQTGPLEHNPAHAPQLQNAKPAANDQAVLLWVAFCFSVLILGGLTLRVARTP